MNAFRNITPHIVAAPVGLDGDKALVALSMIEHRLIYLRGLARDADARLEGSTFYRSVIADIQGDLATVRHEIEAAVRTIEDHIAGGKL